MIPLLLASLSIPVQAASIPEFRHPADHCSGPAGAPAVQEQGGTGSLFTTEAWAEGGVCVGLSLKALLRAAQAVEVMTWGGVTRVNGVSERPLDGFPAGTFRRLRVDYEARHRDPLVGFFCQSAQWPMEWRFRVTRGQAEAPEQAVVEFLRIPGGNGNGSHIRTWSGKVELTAASPEKTSAHMRYEVAAPGQAPEWAGAAVTGYLGKLATKAAGESVPGAAPDPRCPH